jgi:anti-sigma factor RsiW
MTHDGHDHHKCMALFEKMSEYIDRELDAAARAQVEAHIRACCHCHACYETLQRTVDLCQSSAEDYPLSDAFAEKLRNLIEAAGR